MTRQDYEQYMQTVARNCPYRVGIRAGGYSCACLPTLEALRSAHNLERMEGYTCIFDRIMSHNATNISISGEAAKGWCVHEILRRLHNNANNFFDQE